MKFENFEVEEMYYNLHKKYGITHINLGHRFDTRKITYDDLALIEDECIKIDKIFAEIEKEEN